LLSEGFDRFGRQFDISASSTAVMIGHDSVALDGTHRPFFDRDGMTDSGDLPLRIARVITRLNIGGPSIQAITLSDRLRAQGFETLLIHGSLDAGEGDMSYLLDPAEEIETRRVPALVRPVSPVNDLRALMTIFTLLRRYRPAIVHTHMAKAGALARVATAAYNVTAGRDAPAKVVHTYHGHVLEGYFDPGSTNTFIRLERLLARWTDALIAISPTIRDDLVNKYGIGLASQYHVVPLGFDLAPFVRLGRDARAPARRELGLPVDALVVTTVGRLTAIKQHELLLEAAEIVLKHRPEAIVIIAGDGERRRDLEVLAERLGIATRVRFLGWRRDLPTLYAATDVFALTSRNEGTPVALIESMAAGVPGVCTDVGGVKDVIPSRELGVRVPEGDLTSFAFALEALLRDPERRDAMGAAGRRFVIEQYGLGQLVSNIERVYRTLLARQDAESPGILKG
jgi:glycosyltransferase involved in cell wall biosynthesis